MKTKQFTLIVLAVMMLNSCKTAYYQVYKAIPTEQITIEQNALVYEDENCEVTYNLWAEGGNIGFSFYNKTDQNIYFNKAESFFIINGIAHDYYKERIFASGSTTGSTVSTRASASAAVTGYNFLNLLQTNYAQASNRHSIMHTAEQSVSYNEQKVICIPPHTLKYISEYKVTGVLYRDCDLFRYPRRNQIRTKRFYINDSPILFSNRLAYSVGESDELIKFENKFYISEITNYPEKEMTVYKKSEFCGQESKEQSEFFIETPPDNFYIKYEKDYDVWTH